jgi:hypothetical protein
MPIVQGTYGTDSLRTGNKAVRFGQASPTMQFGINNNLILGPWTLYTQFTGQLGGMLYNRVKEDLYDLELHADVDQAGRPAYEKKPSVYYTNQAVAASGSSGLSPDIRAGWFAEDADYLKIAELQVRYRIDKMPAFLNAFGVKQGSIALTGRNLFAFTKYSGYDPEAGTATSRVDNISYPRYRTYSLRTQFTF